MAKFVIVPAQAKRGMKKYVVDAVLTKGEGLPLNPDAESPFDVQYVLPDVEQLKAGMPHYYRNIDRQILFWVQKLDGNLHAMRRLPVRVDIYNSKGECRNALYCYLKDEKDIENG